MKKEEIKPLRKPGFYQNANISCTFSKIPPEFTEALMTHTQKETTEIYYHIYTTVNKYDNKDEAFRELSEALCYNYGHVYRVFYETQRKVKKSSMCVKNGIYSKKNKK